MTSSGPPRFPKGLVLAPKWPFWGPQRSSEGPQGPGNGNEDNNNEHNSNEDNGNEDSGNEDNGNEDNGNEDNGNRDNNDEDPQQPFGPQGQKWPKSSYEIP